RSRDGIGIIKDFQRHEAFSKWNQSDNPISDAKTNRHGPICRGNWRGSVNRLASVLGRWHRGDPRVVWLDCSSVADPAVANPREMCPNPVKIGPPRLSPSNHFPNGARMELRLLCLPA